MKAKEILEFVVCLILFAALAISVASCEDKYLTVERRIIDAENNIPIYFQATAEQDGINTWRPVFTYYIFDLSHSEGKYDAYFHAYIMVEDSIIWSGVQPIEIEGGKKIWGEYIAVGANFNPELVVNSTPMAYVSVSYE